MTVDRAPKLRRIAMALLRQEFPDRLGTVDKVLRVKTETPDNLRELLVAQTCFVRVGQLPGRTTQNQISAILDFDVFALTDDAAEDLALDIDAMLLGRRLLRVASGPFVGESLDTVVSQMSPHTVPWADAGVRRYYSSYAVTARR